ncbi:MAG: hypothetical protein V4732_08030 [Pseudomonadota bacterium]
MQIKIGELDMWLEYMNQDVIDSFQRNLDIEDEAAREVFLDMLRFLWISSRYEDFKVNIIDSPLLIIDEMWHNFVLFTKDYREFCDQYLGFFFHHCPTTKKDIDKHAESIRNGGGRNKLIEIKRERYSHIFDLLGEDVFKRWFLHYPNKYSREKILVLRKK